MDMGSALTITGLASLADLIFNDGKITSKAIDVILKQAGKNIKRKARRRKYLK